MIKDNLSELILESMKHGKKARIDALRAIKAAILNYETAKNAKPLDEIAEINIVRKLVEQREDSAKIYKEANRLDLAEEELKQAEVLREFLPKPISESEIQDVFNELVKSGISPEKKNLGNLIKGIKERLPLANGKLVSQTVMKNLV